MKSRNSSLGWCRKRPWMVRQVTSYSRLLYNITIDKKNVGKAMPKTTVSSKYQVVIPKEIRREVPITTGQVLQVIAKGGVITLVPDRPLDEMKGFLPDLPTKGFRDKGERL